MGEGPLFIDRLHDVVVRHASRPAVLVDGRTAATYSELWQKSGWIARQLQARGMGRECVVGMQLRRGVEWVAALLGIWRAGAAYLPLPLSLPSQRRNFMIADASVEAVIGDLRDDFPEGVERIYVGGSNRLAEEGPLEHPEKSVSDLAYIIYTSGTTGRPKGVAVEQRALVSLLDAQVEAFGLRPESRVLLLLSPAFDASLSDIGTALSAGAAACIETQLDAPCGLGPSAVMETMRRRAITHADVPPALLSAMNADEVPPSLETLVIGGEPCPAPVVRLWSRRLRLVNVYGPTEATICTSLCICDANAWDRSLIGQPLFAVQYRVDPGDSAASDSAVTGELLIGGPCVARGYLNLPKLTAERFIVTDGERWYRTGDLVRREADGEFVFLGRIDRQLKVNGYRIEPEEIEAVLGSYPGVLRSGVLARATGAMSTGKILAAFVQPVDPRCPPDLRKIQLYLARRLPEWMLPQRMVLLDEMPLTVSGKVDAAALAAIQLSARPEAEPSALPLRPFEQELLAVWREVLNDTACGVHDDFFQTGGTSLALFEMLALAQARGIAISPVVAARERTIAGIAAAVAWGAGPCGADAKAAGWLRLDIQSETSELRQLIDQQSRSDRHPLPSSTVLVTGATGFLGCRVLTELLRQTGHTVLCLVRGRDDASACRRLRSWLGAQSISLTEVEWSRVRILAGDVSRPNFGLPAQTWNDLAETVAGIYHCAARVNVLASYEELRPENVGGVLEIARFAASGRPKSLHYASSLSVFVGSDRCTGFLKEADNLSETGEVYGGYAQSKWVAEVLLREAGFPPNRLSIHRFGLLALDARSGRVPQRDLLTLGIRGLMQLRCVPRDPPPLRLDVTPVDYASAAMVRLSRRVESGESFDPGPATFHLAHPSGVRLPQLIRCLRQLEPALTEVDGGEFLERVQDGPNELESVSCLSLCRWLVPRELWNDYRMVDLFPATAAQFDITQATRGLAGSGICCPAADDRFITHLLASILGKPSTSPDTP